MSKDYTAAAQELIGADEQITALGLFELQDNLKAVTVGGMAGSAGVGGRNPLVGALGNAAGMEAGRQANAEAQGVSERMLVAVTDGSIHILAMPMVGGMPERELMCFDRAGTDVEVKRFGLAKHLHLTDRASGHELKLQGATAKFAPGSEGDKAVISELSA
jgi:hypothetical protein